MNLQPCDIADAIIRGRMTLPDIALVLEALAFRAEQMGEIELQTTLEMAQADAEFFRRERERRDDESEREAAADRWLQRRIERGGRMPDLLRKQVA